MQTRFEVIHSAVQSAKGRDMKKLFVAALAIAALAAAAPALAAGWVNPRGLGNTVVSPPVLGGGYPDAPGANAPVAGQCGPIAFNSNHSESWLAVQPGTENVVGASKFFTDR